MAGIGNTARPATGIGFPSVTKTPFSIGAVSLQSPLEAPDELPIGGGAQQLVITKLPGGGRVVNAMGAQFAPVVWTGTIQEPNVRARVEVLRAYMVDGKERLVSWGAEKYFCIVKDFQPRYIKGGKLCRYEISLEITRDANGAFNVAAAASIDDKATQLLASATASQSVLSQQVSLNSLPSAALSASQVSLATTQVAVANASPLAQAPPATLASVLTSVTDSVAKATALASAIGPSSPLYPTAQAFLAQVTLLQNVIGQGQSQNTIRTQGGSLFDLASQYYGDPMRAFDIAGLNGLASPILSTAVSTVLRIPPIAATSTPAKGPSS